MNKYLIAALLTVCGGALWAQQPEVNKKPAAAAKAASAKPGTAVKPPVLLAQLNKTSKTAPVKAGQARSADPDVDEPGVKIDSKADQDEEGDYAAERPELSVPGGLPSSFGQCKGVVNDAGRSILIFESPEDGTVYFVQVTVGKANVSWKLVGRIPRSSD